MQKTAELHQVYLDYNATTPVDPAVAEAMRPYMEMFFGNPSSIHSFGIKARQALEKARKQVAAFLGCYADEIIFTSGGTESNNYAIKGAANALMHKGNHIITSSIEHPSVTEVCRFLEKNGFRISFLPVNEYGCIDPGDLEKTIEPSTILITVMHANNETGSVQPLEEICKIAKQRDIIVHTDAAQSCGKIPVNVKELGVGLLSIAGHKMYAPKGVGALYIRRGVRLEKMIHGADHEMNLRAGTENVLEIVGLGKAAEMVSGNLALSSIHDHLSEMRDQLYEGIIHEIPQARLNGHPVKRLPNTLNISFPGVEANRLLDEMKDVAVSAGAACHSGQTDISQVLAAMNIPLLYAMGTIRFSTGRMTTKNEISHAVDVITKAVKRLTNENIPVQEKIKENQDFSQIRLTSYTRSLGCACKIKPELLEHILRTLPAIKDPAILVDQSTSDDAAVYLINQDTAIVETVDFIPPVVDNPYDYGSIAAANALSDIYAMGGVPLFALNIVAFPDHILPRGVLTEILRGASDKAAEAGIRIIGGHSIQDHEPKFGFAVTGKINPSKIWTNSGAKPGDILILTKPVGTGILSTAMKRGILDKTIADSLVASMKTLNRQAADIFRQLPLNACTDITGFGLLGHLKEMINASGCGAEINWHNVPVLPGTIDLINSGTIPGGTKNNLEYINDITAWEAGMPDFMKYVLTDAQTSGGLLVSLPGIHAETAITELEKAGITGSAIIGTISLHHQIKVSGSLVL